jgi:hypothetical protein
MHAILNKKDRKKKREDKRTIKTKEIHIGSTQKRII